MGTGIHHTLENIVQLSKYDDTCNGIFKKKALVCIDILHCTMMTIKKRKTGLSFFSIKIDELYSIRTVPLGKTNSNLSMSDNYLIDLKDHFLYFLLALSLSVRCTKIN